MIHPLRITQLMLSAGMGGAERYFVDLCIALADRGHAVQAIFHRDFVARDALAAHAQIECVPVRIAGAWDRWARRTIRLHVQQFSPQVMQAHLARGAHIGGAVCAALHIPLTVKTHNRVKLKYYAHVDRFIATTAAQKAYLVEHGVADHRVSIIPNFTALPAVDEIAEPHEPIRFCSYGRMVPKKGFDVLLRAFRMFLDRGERGVLQLGGDGAERRSLESLSAKLNLSAQVEFVGWINRPADILDACDIFVLPSRDEPFGIVLLEAMARGKAIIATRTQGPLEIFDESTTWLTDIGDEIGLADALVYTAQHRESVLAKSQAALESFKQSYAADVVVPRIEQLYAEILSASQATMPGTR